ncbi:MAG TPA: DUF3153 domain-containing protein [Clostridiales bacterium]|nr:DUF3153 domain-containing protein [Clostridiales bacterium]
MRSVMRLIWILAGVLLLSGCARLEMSYIIGDDGTIQASYLIAAENEADSQVDIGDLMNTAREQAVANDFSITDYHKNGYSGFQASKTIKIDDLRNAGSEMLGFSTLPSIIKNYSWLYEPGVFRNHYQLRMTVDLRQIVDEEALDQLPSDLREQALEAVEKGELKINLTLPGKPDYTNASETKAITGKNATLYTWTLKPGDFKSLQIDATLEKDKARNPVVWLAGVLFLFTVFTIVFYLSRSR